MIEENSIIMGKTVLGEMFIGRKDEDVVKNCLTIVLIPDKNNPKSVLTGIGSMLNPILHTETVEINMKHVVCFTQNVPKEMIEGYKKHVQANSFIMVPDLNFTTGRLK